MRAVTTVAFSPEEIEVFERAALAKHVGDPKSERFTEHLKFRYFTEDLTPKNRTELERFYDLLIEIRGAVALEARRDFWRNELERDDHGRMMAEVIIEAREQMLRDLNEALTIVRRALVMATPKVEADEFKAPVWA